MEEIEKVETTEQAPAEATTETPTEETQEDINSDELELAKAMIAEADAKVAKEEVKRKQAEYTIEKLKKQLKEESPEEAQELEINLKIDEKVNEAIAKATAELTEKLAETTSAKVSKLEAQLRETRKAALKKTSSPEGSSQKLPHKEVDIEAPDPALVKLMEKSGHRWEAGKGWTK